ncbi:hypothetical protein K458DRAFT_449952, partial [Lentithecium fluviatile CBS 122367]
HALGTAQNVHLPHPSNPPRSEDLPPPHSHAHSHSRIPPSTHQPASNMHTDHAHPLVHQKSLSTAHASANHNQPSPRHHLLVRHVDGQRHRRHDGASHDRRTHSDERRGREQCVAVARRAGPGAGLRGSFWWRGERKRKRKRKRAGGREGQWVYEYGYGVLREGYIAGMGWDVSEVGDRWEDGMPRGVGWERMEKWVGGREIARCGGTAGLNMKRGLYSMAMGWGGMGWDKTGVLFCMYAALLLLDQQPSPQILLL